LHTICIQTQSESIVLVFTKKVRRKKCDIYLAKHGGDALM
jgi:hypothetical protein